MEMETMDDKSPLIMELNGDSMNFIAKTLDGRDLAWLTTKNHFSQCLLSYISTIDQLASNKLSNGYKELKRKGNVRTKGSNNTHNDDATNIDCDDLDNDLNDTNKVVKIKDLIKSIKDDNVSFKTKVLEFAIKLIFGQDIDTIYNCEINDKAMVINSYADTFSSCIVDDRVILESLNNELKSRVIALHGEFNNGGNDDQDKTNCQHVFDEVKINISTIRANNNITNNERNEKEPLETPFLDVLAYLFRGLKWNYSIGFEVSLKLLCLFYEGEIAHSLPVLNMVIFDYFSTRKDTIDICFDKIVKFTSRNNEETIIRAKKKKVTTLFVLIKTNNRLKRTTLCDLLVPITMLKSKGTNDSSIEGNKRHSINPIFEDFDNHFNFSMEMIYSPNILKLKPTKSMRKDCPNYEFRVENCHKGNTIEYPNGYTKGRSIIRNKNNVVMGHVKSLLSISNGLSDFSMESELYDDHDSEDNDHNGSHKSYIPRYNRGQKYLDANNNKKNNHTNNNSGNSIRKSREYSIDYVTEIINVESGQIYSAITFKFYGIGEHDFFSSVNPIASGIHTIRKRIIQRGVNKTFPIIELDNSCFIANLNSIKVCRKNPNVLFSIYGDDMRDNDNYTINDGTFDNNNKTSRAQFFKSSSKRSISSSFFFSKSVNTEESAHETIKTEKGEYFDFMNNLPREVQNSLSKKRLEEVDDNFILLSKINPWDLLKPYDDKTKFMTKAGNYYRMGFLTMVTFSKSMYRILDYKFIGGSIVNRDNLSFQVPTKSIVCDDDEEGHLLVYHFSDLISSDRSPQSKESNKHYKYQNEKSGVFYEATYLKSLEAIDSYIDQQIKSNVF